MSRPRQKRMNWQEKLSDGAMLVSGSALLTLGLLGIFLGVANLLDGTLTTVGSSPWVLPIFGVVSLCVARFYLWIYAKPWPTRRRGK